MIVFDMDMTLIDSFESFSNFLNAISLEHYNKTISKSLVKKLWGTPHKEFITKIFEGIDTYENVRLHIENKLKHKPLIQPAVENALNAVKELHGRYIMGILTSSPRIDVESRLKNAGFDLAHFEIIICSDDTTFRKPDPRVFDSLDPWIKTKNLTKNNILYIGDSIVDYKAAKGAQVKFIGVTTGFDNKDRFLSEGLPPENVIDSLSEAFKNITLMN